MSWNYRIMQHTDRFGTTYYSLREVYYDRRGKVEGWTQEPVHFGCDADEGPEGIVKSLEMALADAKKHSVLVDPDRRKRGSRS